MTRLRTLLALACLAFALGVAPAIAQESPPGGTPAVVVEEEAPVATEPVDDFVRSFLERHRIRSLERGQRPRDARGEFLRTRPFHR